MAQPLPGSSNPSNIRNNMLVFRRVPKAHMASQSFLGSIESHGYHPPIRNCTMDNPYNMFPHVPVNGGYPKANREGYFAHKSDRSTKHSIMVSSTQIRSMVNTSAVAWSHDGSVRDHCTPYKVAQLPRSSYVSSGRNFL